MDLQSARDGEHGQERRADGDAFAVTENEPRECVEYSVGQNARELDMRSRPSQLLFVFVALLFACGRPEPLTAEKAQAIINESSYKREPIYAEVPQKVWWSPRAPKDDYDEKALRTLRNLEREGLVTITATESPDSATYIAKVTKKGFPILGTAPSYRGPVYRAQIAEKHYDGIRNFVRHPTQPTVGHAELVWHYANPTPYYAMFETKIDKPLQKPFASHVSFWYGKHEWRFEVNVKKTQPAA
jgi:hypothetical protein